MEKQKYFLFILLFITGCSNLNKVGYSDDQDKYGVKLSTIYFQTENDPSPFIKHFLTKFGNPSYLEPTEYIWDSVYNPKWYNGSFNFSIYNFRFENG